MSAADPVKFNDTGNVWIDAITWGSKWKDAAGPTDIKTYIAGMNGPETVDFGGRDISATTPYFEEIAAMLNAMKSISDVCNIHFVNTSTMADADIVWSSVNDTDAEGALGIAVPPLEYFNPEFQDYQSAVLVNYQAYNPDFPDANLLTVGGFDYISFFHELGHALGLAHPHDNGGLPSDPSTIFPGVTGPFDSFGQFNMNQGIFTMMSYNDGWSTGPQGKTPSQVYGYEGGPMALDIAALQLMYGKNTTFHTGSDTYALPDTNKVGTYYKSIWDAGGVDIIVGSSTRANVIDLHAATLQKAAGGGGFVSYAAGIHGGFTIANGVVIENAMGGEANDKLIGNAAGNTLWGLQGNDTIIGDSANDKLRGGDGNDVIIGDIGKDAISGDLGSDTLDGGAGADSFYYNFVTESQGTSFDHITNFVSNVDQIVLSNIDANDHVAGNQAFKFIGAQVFHGVAGELRAVSVSGDTTVSGDINGDRIADIIIKLDGTPAVIGGDFVL